MTSFPYAAALLVAGVVGIWGFLRIFEPKATTPRILQGFVLVAIGWHASSVALDAWVEALSL
jgi:hypothetical protein